MITPALLGVVAASRRRAAGDQYWSAVVLLIQNQAADGNTSFVDSSNDARTVTTGSPAQHDTSTFPWGTSSIEFDGNTASLFLADAPAWAFPSDYTIDFAIRPGGTPVNDFGLLSQSRTFSFGETIIKINSARRIVCYWESPVSGISTLTGTVTLALNTWYHVRICRSAGTTRIFINGVLDVAGTWSPGTDWTSGLYIGRHYYSGGFLAGRNFLGHLQAIRWTTVARSIDNSSFTPPTGPYPTSL
jgi:hypothetical protein